MTSIRNRAALLLALALVALAATGAMVAIGPLASGAPILTIREGAGGTGAGEAPDGIIELHDVPVGSPTSLLLHAIDEAEPARVRLERPVRSDRSPALRSIPVRAGGGTFEEHPVKPRKQVGAHGASRSGGGTVREPDPVIQDATAATNQQLSAIVAFDGVDNRNALVPPDPSGDIGPNHYVQWVNTSFAVFDRSGAVLYGPTNGNALWAGFGGVCEQRNDGDPIVQYDQLADRWLVSQFAVPGRSLGFHQCIAISATPDPTGAWYRYDFLMSAKKMNDYPKFGVWPDGYYLSVNQFQNGSYAGAAVAVFERERLLAGDPNARMIITDLAADPTLGSLLPSDLDGPRPPAGTPNIYAQVDDGDWGYTNGVDQVQLFSYSVDWTAGSATFAKVQTIPVAPFDWNLCGGARDCIPQPGTSATLDALSERLLYRLAYRIVDGRPMLVLNHSVDADGTDRAGVRWYQLEQPVGAAWRVRQQGTFAPADGLSRWMGSAAMNKAGDIAIAYSVAGTALFPSLRHTGRLATDASAGQMTLGEAVLAEGAGAQSTTTSRWGDYSQLSVDPRDDCTFWYTGEYLASSGVAPWRTRIGSFRLSACGLPAGTLTGRVTDAVSGRPVAGATVTILGLGARTTGVAGDYTYTAAYAGSYLATISAPGYLEATAGVTIAAGATVRLDLPLTALTATGWTGPSWTAAGPGGDGDGYETGATVTALAASGGSAAADVRSGTKNSTQCDSTARDRQDAGVALSIAAGRTVTGIAVRLRASASTTSGTPRLCVLLSWDGGRSWTDPKMSPALTTGGIDYVLGGATDPWQVSRRNRSWTPAELAALRVRVVDIGSTTAATYYLDALEVNASYK